MPYVVSSMLFSCSKLHEPHAKLADAAACFAEITRIYGEDIPIHPVSQKYVYAIDAVDRAGNQIDFSDAAKAEGKRLNLDPKSLVTRVPGITTFSHLAKLYYDASRLIPITSINLEGILDYKNKDSHFWTTDAGIGQALAFAQQAAFTLELCFKAVLEVLGKLAATDVERGRPPWRTHDLIELFDILTEEEQAELERWWNNSDAKKQHFNGTFPEFLSSSNKLYLSWRYITDLRSADLSIDIKMLLSGASFLISASDRLWWQRAPFKVKSTVTTYTDAADATGKPMPPDLQVLIEGRVRSVKIPEGFEPNSLVEVVIDSDRHEHAVTTFFYKRNVSDYFGIEGNRVALAGYVNEDEPHLLHYPRLLDHAEEFPKEPSYSSQGRTLRGSVYDLIASPSLSGRATNIKLVLYDKTFFTLVECFFLTEEERGKLAGIKHGDQILIRGCVTLLNGKPVALFSPDFVEQVNELPDSP